MGAHPRFWNHSLSSIKNASGYSLIDVIVAMVISGIILAVLMGGVILYRDNENKIKTSTDLLVELSAFGTQFSSMVERADLSMQYMHLPISTDPSCDDTIPCVRKYNDSTHEFTSLGDNTDITNLYGGVPAEFFRDSSGQIVTNIPVLLGTLTDTFLAGSLGVDTFGLDTGHSYYTTWPLLDKNSAPFPLLVRSREVFYLQVPEISATLTPPTPEMVVEIHGTLPQATQIENLTHRFLLAFNSNENRHFAMQKLMEFKPCKDNLTQCQDTLKAASIVFDPADPMTNKVLVRLEKPEDDNFNGLLAEPSITQPYKWPNQYTNYLFPGRVNLIRAMDPDLDPSVAFDIRKWIHFGHTKMLPSDIILLPVELHFFKINEIGLKKQLIRTEYTHGTAPTEYIELDDLKNKVIFGRKIGTGNLEVRIYTEKATIADGD